MSTEPLENTTRTFSRTDVRCLVKAFASALEAIALGILDLREDHNDAAARDRMQGEVSKANKSESIPAEVREAYERVKATGEAIDTLPAEVWHRSIRTRLLVALKQQNMSQAALAKLVGKAESHVSRVLKKPESRQLATLKAIADALKVDLADIVSAIPLPTERPEDDPLDPPPTRP